MTNDEHPQHSLDEFDLFLSDAFHLSSVELAGYLEGFCSPQEKARIDAHVVSCVRCETVIADAQEYLRLFDNDPAASLPIAEECDRILKKANAWLRKEFSLADATWRPAIPNAQLGGQPSPPTRITDLSYDLPVLEAVPGASGLVKIEIAKTGKRARVVVGIDEVPTQPVPNDLLVLLRLYRTKRSPRAQRPDEVDILFGSPPLVRTILLDDVDNTERWALQPVRVGFDGKTYSSVE